MDKLKLIVSEGEPSESDMKALSEGLLAHHASKGHPRKSTIYSVFIKDKQDKVVGGVVVSFLWNGMYVQSLWTDESIRGHGWARKLMNMVEAEAKKRGCTLVYTNTFSWQAPEFYTKLGYKVYGKLDGFPEGNTLSFFRKDLV